jgi:hypothetical protein
MLIFKLEAEKQTWAHYRKAFAKYQKQNQRESVSDIRRPEVVIEGNAIEDIVFPRPQLPASNSNSSQRLNLSSSQTDWLTHSLTKQDTPLHWLTNCSLSCL